MTGLFRVLLMVAISAHVAAGQHLSTSQKATLQAARAKYYNLELQGFMSASCQVRFDIPTLPVLETKMSEPDRKVLQNTRFMLQLDSRHPPSVHIVYPNAASDSGEHGYVAAANLIQSLVNGFFQTWPSKGLDGPIPPFDSQIGGVSTTDRGYSVTLLVPGAPVRLEMDKNYLVTQITSPGGKIDERPVYVPSPSGLIFASNSVTDDSEQGGQVKVAYEIQNAVMDSLQLPNSVHLRVNDNIDVRFALTECSVSKGKVLEVKAP